MYNGTVQYNYSVKMTMCVSVCRCVCQYGSSPNTHVGHTSVKRWPFIGLFHALFCSYLFSFFSYSAVPHGNKLVAANQSTDWEGLGECKRRVIISGVKLCSWLHLAHLISKFEFWNLPWRQWRGGGGLEKGCNKKVVPWNVWLLKLCTNIDLKKYI